ncbi:SPX domain-containing protein [Cavenderia fasciculata]|uniref:SPX domain-containing protein n=1 Tax=Cavenderia fasciculata TaxID=261658 RepID=F4Q5B1_CACFS|nr:SPX domain-containing protein [Cavenderia fasciculata]EGG17170.1 SPX domain-containing protein [Cavenderia fasciculata]|eukprot:XP_004355654.1 SPX domain-containing protein [Cavenderia fasciculata]
MRRRKKEIDHDYSFDQKERENMVKYRNHLKSVAVDQWRDKYLDYEYLKSLLENEYKNAPPSLNEDTHSNMMNIRGGGGGGGGGANSSGLLNRRKLLHQLMSSPNSSRRIINDDEHPAATSATPVVSPNTAGKKRHQRKDSDGVDSDNDDIELQVLNQLSQSMMSNKSTMSSPTLYSHSQGGFSSGHLDEMVLKSPTLDADEHVIERVLDDSDNSDHHEQQEEQDMMDEAGNEDQDEDQDSSPEAKSPLNLVKTPLLNSSTSSTSSTHHHRQNHKSQKKKNQKQHSRRSSLTNSNHGSSQDLYEQTQKKQEQSNHLHLPQIKEIVPLSLEETAFSKEPSPVHLSPVLNSSSPLPPPPPSSLNVSRQQQQHVRYAMTSRPQSPASPRSPQMASVIRPPYHSGNQRHHSISIPDTTGVDNRPTSNSFVPIEDLIRGPAYDTCASPPTTLIHEPTFQEEFLYQLDKIDTFFIERFHKIKYKIIDHCNMIQFIKAQSDKKVRNSRNISFIKEGFQDNYRVLIMLSSFRLLNKEGFEKLLEKYKKCNSILTNSLKEELEMKIFFDEDEIGKLIHQIKYIYARYFTGNDKRLAKNELRSPVAGDNRGLVFTVGLLIGFCIMLGGLSIYTYHQYYPHDNPPHNAPLAWLLFRITLLPVLLGTLFALQTFIFERTKINYVFIFQLKPEYSRSSLLYFKFGLIFISFWLLCLYFYIDTTSTPSNIRISPIIFPILFMITSVVVIALPFPVFAHKTRFWALKTFGRVLCAPWVRVHFKDFFMSVQLLSLGDFFFNIQSMICIFNYNALDPEELSFCYSTSFLALPILNGLPYYLRIMQCFRRYYETRCFFPHITSAIRSMFSLVTLVLAYLALLIKHDAKWNEIKTIWFFLSIVGSLYKWYADMAVDWGFLLSPSTNKFWPLREKLVFSKYKFIYYIAMVLDLFLRYLWLLVFLIRDNTSHRLDNPLFLFFLSMGEVFWATQFIFFRVESEHCQTADKYSVYHDIPMPFTQEYNNYLDSKKINQNQSSYNNQSNNNNNQNNNTSINTPTQNDNNNNINNSNNNNNIHNSDSINSLKNTNNSDNYTPSSNSSTLSLLDNTNNNSNNN